jgi:SAM-dependent methyltransferase
VTIAAAGAVEVENLLAMINANWMTQVIGVAAELRIADLLAAGVRQGDQLALAAACDPASLHRLLRALCSLGICAAEPDGAFALTPMGALLRADAQPCVRSWAIYTALCQWEVWGHLIDSVRSGASARKLLTGREGYAHLEGDARAASVFNSAMVELTQITAAAVAREGDFAGVARVVDVGGGHGELLAAVLAAHPHLRGAVFDLPHAMDGARARMAEADGRCEFIAGSFFENVPRADLHLLKSILHNWNDGQCLEILGQCRRAAAPGGRLLVVDRVMPDRVTGTPEERGIVRADLNMMVSLGGRERTASEFEAMLATAGYHPLRCVGLGLGYSMIEARAEREPGFPAAGAGRGPATAS